MEWIRKARLQSNSTKNKIALIFAAAITLLIVGLWLLVLQNRNTPDEIVADSKSSELKPLFMIFKNAKDDFKDIKTDIKTHKASTADAVPSNADVVE